MAKLQAWGKQFFRSLPVSGKIDGVDLLPAWVAVKFYLKKNLCNFLCRHLRSFNHLKCSLANLVISTSIVYRKKNMHESY